MTRATAGTARTASPRTAVAAIGVLPSPYGPVNVAVTDDAVVGLEMRSTPGSFTTTLRRRWPGPIESDPPPAATGRRSLLDRLADEVAEYFEGDRRSFDVPVDLPGLSAWDRRVLGAVRAVQFGTTTSYGGIAATVGARGAARAVGGAVGRNPIGLLIPCHRVIAGDGSLGGYGRSWSADGAGMLELKRSLLALEGVSVTR